MSQFILRPTTELVGQGTIPSTVLASGSTFTVRESVPLLPVPALWDPTSGVRMGLKDDRHIKEPMARITASLALHVLPPGVTPPGEKGAAAAGPGASSGGAAGAAGAKARSPSPRK